MTGHFSHILILAVPILLTITIRLFLQYKHIEKEGNLGCNCRNYYKLEENNKNVYTAV